jgi:hypothetical protein
MEAKTYKGYKGTYVSFHGKLFKRVLSHEKIKEGGIWLWKWENPTFLSGELIGKKPKELNPMTQFFNLIIPTILDK